MSFWILLKRHRKTKLMQRVLNFGLRPRIITDLALLFILLITMQRYYGDGVYHFFDSTTIGVLLTCLSCWYIAARAFGLYIDYREKPFSTEWIAFLKTFIIYSLVVSFIF